MAGNAFFRFLPSHPFFSRNAPLKIAPSPNRSLHLYKRDVRKIFIPVIPTTQQKQFETFAPASFSAWQEAQSLLKLAKRAVEIAIEEGETAGMEFLK